MIKIILMEKSQFVNICKVSIFVEEYFSLETNGIISKQ
jgi:hypothetical protein